MAHALLHDPGMNTLVFEGRNQSYGAYELRLGYEQRMAKGMFTASFLFLMMVLIPFISPFLISRRPAAVPEVTREVILSIIDPELKPKPFKIETAVPVTAKTKQIKFTAPVVVSDELPVLEEIPPTLHDIRATNTGTATVDTSLGTGEDIPLSQPIPDDQEIIFDPMENPMESFSVQQQPQFENGMQALYNFLSRELTYPREAQENRISGTVYVEFIINTKGHVEHARVIRGVGGGLDQEALRVVNKMPAWKPGQHNGSPVSVIMRLPVNFQLLP